MNVDEPRKVVGTKQEIFFQLCRDDALYCREWRAGSMRS